MFALPHHLESLSEKDSSMCFHTFHGRTCLVHGNTWALPVQVQVQHGAPQSFIADRPPLADVIPDIADALKEDIKHKLSSNILRGLQALISPQNLWPSSVGSLR